MDDAPAIAPPLGGQEPPATRDEPRSLGRFTLGLAALALLGYAAGALLLALPVRTPEVQDCGAPGAYLIDGRIDVVPDAEDRILDGDGAVVTLPPAVAAAARETPCRQRVAARAVPAVVLIGGAAVVGLAAFALELFIVRPRRRRARATPAHEGELPTAPAAGGPDWPT